MGMQYTLHAHLPFSLDSGCQFANSAICFTRNSF